MQILRFRSFGRHFRARLKPRRKVMAFLVNQNPQGLTQRFELDGETMALGRHPDCHVVIEDNSVSRFHAQISWDGAHFFLEDLGSRNGTFLNEAKILRPAVLQAGDTIRICDLSFGFHTSENEGERPELKLARFQEDPNGFTLEKSVVWEEEERESDGSTIMSQVPISSILNQESSTKIGAAVKLQAMMDIVRSLSGSISLQSVGPKVLDCLLDMFQNADRGFIVLSEDETQLRPIATKTRGKENSGQMRVSRTVFKHILETKEAVLSADTAADERFDASASIVDIEIQSMICAPLVDKDENVMGMLQLDSVRKNVAFREEDLELLVVVAMAAASSIEKAHMLEVELEQQQVRQDLQLASRVQTALLPNRRPQCEKIDYFDYYQSADQVGGDTFDYISLPNGRVAILVADVVGHGVAAALLMAKFSAEARFALTHHEKLSDAVEALNDAMSHLQIDRFITMVVSVLDPKTGNLTIVNAGHTLPIIRRKSGDVEVQDVAINGLPLGVIGQAKYNELSLDLNQGDWVTLYTDGLNEQVNATGKQFGVKQLTREIEAFSGENAEDLGKGIVASVRLHSGKVDQADDMCVVCFGPKSL